MKNLAYFSLEQLCFINSFIEHRDVSRAVRDSGYFDGEEGVTQAAVIKLGAEWLSEEAVINEIDRRLRVIATAAAVTQSEIVDELRKIAFLDLRELYREDGSLKDVHELGDDTAHALMAFDVVQAGETGVVTKVTSNSKMKALELLGKHSSMFVERVEHEHKGSAGFTHTWVLPEGDDGEGLGSDATEE